MGYILTIFRKELKDMLRDRRTVLTMIVMPLFLIPLIISLTSSFTSRQNKKESTKILRVALQTNDNGADLAEQLRLRKDIEITEDVPSSDISDLVKADSFDVGFVIEEGFDDAIANGQTGGVRLFYRESGSRTFVRRLQTTTNSYEDAILQQRLDSLGTNLAMIDPVKVERENVYSQRESIGKLAGAFLPYLFVLFCFMGAMYPAIDLFTGEKERSTIETLLVVPANRIQLLVGKMLVVITTGVISGLLTIIGLFLALKVNPDIPSDISDVVLQILSPGSIAIIIAMMIPLTTFFAGILIPMAIYAKSFKEAQSLIQPMVIVAIIPLVIGLLPGFELNPVTAMIPILNVSLACKDIVAGTVDYGLLAILFTSLFVMATIGIMLSRRGFSNEGNILRI